MIAKSTKTTLFAPLISATVSSFGLDDTLASRQLGKNTSSDLKDAKIFRGSKARNILFLTVIGTGLLMIGGIDAVSACSLSNHCYAQCTLNGLSGDLPATEKSMV